MSEALPRAAGEAVARGLLKAQPEDFLVYEELGFEPGGEGEHVFLHLEKRLLNYLMKFNLRIFNDACFSFQQPSLSFKPLLGVNEIKE